MFACSMNVPHGPELDARSRRLLRALIGQYLADGEPVGSRTLSKSSGLDVSPATIRNIMADLEESGLVASPHTSAGRIPTPRGLRLFVDSLLELRPLTDQDMQRLRQQLPAHPGQRHGPARQHLLAAVGDDPFRRPGHGAAALGTCPCATSISCRWTEPGCW